MTLDAKTLFEMVKTAAASAQRSLKTPDHPDQNLAFTAAYAGYAIYMQQYNEFASLTIELYGDEARRLFPLIAQDYMGVPPISQRAQYRPRLEMVSVRLNSMVAYLKTKLNIVDQQIEGIMDFIEANLRPTIRKDPENEKEVQDKLEDLFRARGFDFQRDVIVIPYSTKNYKPDFTFEGLDLAIEAKLCNKKEREKAIVEEINSDIPAYQTKYKYAIFVIYDLGFIRDQQTFRSGIESNPDVYVKVIKK